MMRTSGVGRDAWMLSVPVGILVIVALFIAGGPEDLLRYMERSLESMVGWVVDLTS
jgi:hypothetical protein